MQNWSRFLYGAYIFSCVSSPGDGIDILCMCSCFSCFVLRSRVLGNKLLVFFFISILVLLYPEIRCSITQLGTGYFNDPVLSNSLLAYDTASVSKISLELLRACHI